MAGPGQIEQSINVQDMIAILKRRFLWAAIPAAAGVLLAVVLAIFWPAEYESGTVVLVQPKGIPDQLAASTVAYDTEAAFNAIRLRIMTRDHLSKVIDALNLYQDSNDTRTRQITHMRSKITIEPIPPAIIDPRKPIQVNSFRIAFRDPDPKVARNVAAALTREFQKTNLAQRSEQAQGTHDFIRAELDRARDERGRVGRELSDYKEKHRGELPEDLRINQHRLETLSGQRGQALAGLDTARDRRDHFRKEMLEVSKSGSREEVDPVARERAVELLLRQHLSMGKTEKHPDVVIARQELMELNELIDSMESEQHAITPEAALMRRAMSEQMVRANVLQKQLARIDEAIARFEERILNTPRRSSEIGHLEAQYSSLTQSIVELQSKQVAASIGLSLESSQQGERFQIVESALVPTEPISPNRPLILVVGSAAGLLIGMLLMGLREMGDESFHSVSDLQNALGLPVLGAIPAIQIGGARTSRLRRWVGVGMILVAFHGVNLGSEPTDMSAAPIEIGGENV
jgi:uncharacterized protein involved in exopolysaccharide biosynthesis